MTEEARRYHGELVRGAAVNAVGLAAKLVQPLLFLLVTWLFGPVVMGVYFLATALGNLAATAVTSGYVDATTIYGSHDADRAAEDGAARGRLYQVLGNGFALSVGASALLIVTAHLGAASLVARFYPAHPDLVPALLLVAWSLPATAFAQIAIAATKIRMRMEYDASILGFAQPLILLGLCLVAWWLGAGLVGLMAAHLGTQLAVALLAAWAYARHFDVRRTAAAVLRPKLHRAMLSFALPQNLNMTFNQYITRLDVIMLAALGHSAVDVALYGTAALITSNLRQVKLVFSSALAPVAARHHAAGDRADLEATLGRVARWTTSLVVPLLLLVVVLRDDVLRFIDRSYAGDTRFVVVLLLPPFLSCAVGLAGNCIIFTGHSRWTLLNSTLIAVLNTGFNLLLIPRYGLLGAALATAIASSCISVLQIVELRALERVTIRLRQVYKPHLGLAAAAALVIALWDPARLWNVGARVGLALGLVLAYGAVLLALRHEELTDLVRRRARRAEA